MLLETTALRHCNVCHLRTYSSRQSDSFTMLECIVYLNEKDNVTSMIDFEKVRLYFHQVVVILHDHSRNNFCAFLYKFFEITFV